MLPAERYDGDFYPGSKTPVKDYTREKYGPPPETDLLPDPAVQADGTDYWTLGALALLLERSVVTLRRWEVNGDLPRTPWRLAARTTHGMQRLYTRAMLEGLAKIAYEEGLIANTRRKLSTTNFRKRAHDLFKELT